MNRNHSLFAAAVVLLSGCAVSQSASFAPASGAIPSRHATPLLYAAQDDKVDEFAYPSSDRVGRIPTKAGVMAVCAGTQRGVWVTEAFDSYSRVAEYAPGAKTPTAEMSVPGSVPFGCAVDPSSGDLAIGTSENGTAGASVVIFPQAPRFAAVRYSPLKFARYFYCAYDGAGNLFVDGYDDASHVFLIELEKGASKFEMIHLDRQLGGAGGVVWDGTDLAVADATTTSIYRFAISGTHAKTLSTTVLNGSDYLRFSFAIEGGTVIANLPWSSNTGGIGYWNYPSGGDAVKTFAKNATYRSFTVVP